MSTVFSRESVFQECVAHFTREIGRTSLEMRPFPHLVIRTFFPTNIYQRLLNELPATKYYQPFDYEKHASKDGSSTRDRFQLIDDALAPLPDAQRNFLLGIRDALGCAALKQAVFQRLAAGLAIRFGTDEIKAAEVPAYPLPEFFREQSGYAIKPHPDTRKKIVTMQIALPRDESQSTFGTEFYSRSLNPLSLTREPRGFDVVKTMPFLPNVAYAFTVLNNWKIKSWHGRTKLPYSPGERNTILNIWYAKPEQANSDIIREHYSSQSSARRAA